VTLLVSFIDIEGTGDLGTDSEFEP